MSLKTPQNVLITLNQVIWIPAESLEGTGFCFTYKLCKVPDLLFIFMVKLLIKEERSREKENDITDSTRDILNVFRANDSLPFPLNRAIMNITNVSVRSFFSISSPFLGYFHPSIFISFLVVRYGFEYISAKLHKWPIWLSLGESDSENGLEVSIVTSPQDLVLVPLMSTLVCWRSKAPFCIAGPVPFASS